VEIHAESYATERPGVFAGGDVVTGPGTVIGAVAAGKNAAVMIDRYLKGKMLRLLPTVVLPSVYVAPVEAPEEEAALADRVTVPHRPMQERVKSFAEVELCISAQAAKAEACRCLRCDLDFTQPD
jgi:NADH-quinone oxidoreductase subunit F